MPDPITWYTLGRTVADPERIMAVMDEKFLSHNQDPSAHGQTSEAVHVHRTDEPFDHPQYVVYNINMAPSTRTVKAFADAGGAAEFERIEDAIGYVNGLGGGTVHVKPGTYYITANLNMPSNVNLIGEDPTDCILDFGSAAYSIRIDGTLVGGRRDVHFENLTFQNCYDYLEGALYFKSAPDCSVENCRFTNNWDVGNSRGREITVDGCLRFTLEGNKIFTTSGEVYFTGYIDGSRVLYNRWDDAEETCFYMYGAGVTVTGNIVDQCAGDYVFYLEQDEYSTYIGNSLWGATVSVIRLNGCNYVKLIGNEFVGQSVANYAIEADTNCQGLVISNNYCGSLMSDGIIIKNSDFVIISGNTTADDHGDGVVIDDAGCLRCVVVGNRLEGGVLDNGTDTEVGHNTEGG